MNAERQEATRFHKIERRTIEKPSHQRVRPFSIQQDPALTRFPEDRVRL